MIADDMNSSFYLFNALNADNIKKFKANQKCNPKKKEKSKKLQSTVHFDVTPVDLKTVKEKKKNNKKKETRKKEGDAVVKKYKFIRPEVKTFSDVTLTPNTTFDRLLHSSRKPLADKYSVLNVNPQVECINSDLLSTSHCLSTSKRGNETSTPILISPIFPAVADRKKLRNSRYQTGGETDNFLTPVLRYSFENVEKSSQQSSSLVVASHSSSSPSPLLCNREHTCGETESLHNKIIASHKWEDSLSPIGARTRSSTANENLKYKNIQSSDSSENSLGIKMRLRRTNASENERHNNNNNNDSSCNSDESFFSTVKVQREKNKKVNTRCNKVASTRSSGKFVSPVITYSKRNSKTKSTLEKTTGDQEIMSTFVSDERFGGDSVCIKRKNSCNIDESMPSLFKTKQKGSANCCNNSNDENYGRFLLPLVRRSQRNKSGSSCENVTSNSPKCVQLKYATYCESPDMFSSLDEIETDIVPSKYVTVVENYNSNFSTCSINHEDNSSRNFTSSSVVEDNSREYNVSCISSIVIDSKSDVVRGSVGNNINFPSQDNNTLLISSSDHAGPSDSTIASLQSSYSNNVVNQLCADGSQSSDIEFDHGGSFKATTEINKCSRIIQKHARSCYGAACISSRASQFVACIPSHSEISISAYQEESENLSNALSKDANSRESDYCKGQSLTHSMTSYCKENSERLNSSLSRRSSLCRRLSHVVIPERWKQRSANETLQVSVRRAAPLSASVIVEDDEPDDEALTQGGLPARDMVLGKCNQSEPLAFEKAFPQRFFDNCKKIGEGLYGEVFFCQYDCAPGKVLKIIPIEGVILVNGEKQKKYSEVLSELVIAIELSNLRHDTQFKTSCFVEVSRCVCVQGKYPQRLIDLWNEYHEEKVSENDSPTIFDDSQLFVIFELADGGKALETYCFTSAAQAFSAFVQLTFALAVAEVTLEFEHRDLHWGNVLIKKTPAKHITFKLNGKEFLVPSNGIQVTIIDYTLSRMSYGGCCIFNDLAVDPELFVAQGDYQFEVYRLMQNAVKNEWNNFRPYTNILWLHYILGKMLQGVHYKNISTKIHKKFKTKLTDCYNGVLKHNSAYDLVTTGNLLEMIK